MSENQEIAPEIVATPSETAPDVPHASTPGEAARLTPTPEEDARVAALRPTAETFFQRYRRDGVAEPEALQRACEDAAALYAMAQSVHRQALDVMAPPHDGVDIARDVTAILTASPVEQITAQELLPELAGVDPTAWRAQHPETQRLLVTLLAKARLADKLLADAAGARPAGASPPATRPPAAAPPAVNVPGPRGERAVDGQTLLLRQQLRAANQALTDDQLDAAITRAREKGR